jgi:replication factor C small subunit
MLFIGQSGTGKTATAYALANHLGVSIIEYNASDERGIDFIRMKIKNDLKTAFPKIVLLDEADALTKDAQQALRRLLERYLKAPSRIIMTANNLHKIIDAILSRTAVFKFKPISKENCIRLLYKVAVREGMIKNRRDEQEKMRVAKVLKFLYDYTKGDLRKAITTLQTIHNSNQELSEEIIRGYYESVEFAKQIVTSTIGGNDWKEILTNLEILLIQRNMNPHDVVQELYEASKSINDPLLLAKFLKSLKQTDGFLNYPETNPLVQLASCLMELYVYTHSKGGERSE